MEDDDTEGGVGKDFPLKVGQHIFCDILYYEYVFNPRGNEKINCSTQLTKSEAGQSYRSGYELVFKKIPCLLCVLLHVFGVEDTFMVDDDIEMGVAKYFLLKVGEHIYCDILYYAYVLTLRQ